MTQDTDIVELEEIQAIEAQLPAVREEQALVPHDAAPPTVLDQAIRLASIQGIDKDMFDRIMAANEREIALQAGERFNEAMNKAQAEIMPVARTAENKQTNSFYAKLEAVDAAIRPIYLKHGFSVAYNTVPPLADGNIRVECEVSLGRHAKKYYREAPADTLGPKGSAVKTVLHGGGSTETYLKRYLVCGAFNVVFRNLDDDGNTGGATHLTPEQVAKISKAIEETDTDPRAFFSMMISDPVNTFEDIRQIDFDRLMNALILKKNRMAKGDKA